MSVKLHKKPHEQAGPAAVPAENRMGEVYQKNIPAIGYYDIRLVHITKSNPARMRTLQNFIQPVKYIWREFSALETAQQSTTDVFNDKAVPAFKAKACRNARRPLEKLIGPGLAVQHSTAVECFYQRAAPAAIL
jgi:hypothetical protein